MLNYILNKLDFLVKRKINIYKENNTLHIELSVPFVKFIISKSNVNTVLLNIFCENCAFI